MLERSNSNRDRFLESVAKYLDGNLSDEETRQLDEMLLRDAARRTEFVDFCIQAHWLREYGASFIDVETVARPSGDFDRIVDLPNIDSPGPSQFERGKSSTASAGHRTRWRVAVLGAIAAAILVAVLIRTQSLTNSSVAAVSRVQGNVFVTRGKNRLTVGADTKLRDGDTIVVDGPQGHAALAYADGTRLQLVGDSSMTIENNGKQIRLVGGTLTASVAPQMAESPLTLLTACASVRVLGTVFSIAAAHDRTDVSVDEGRVRMTNVADGATVEVAEGEFAVADRQHELIVRDIPRPPDEFGADFESGLPSDWRVGVFEKAGLPGDSQGAVRAVCRENENGVYYQIQSPKKWSEGIFSIHGDTHLHVTFKLERPDWFQVFIGTRPFDPDLPATYLYRFKDDRLWKWSNRNRWLRVTIPLTEFERVPERKGTPPLGEVPFELLFSAKGEDRGMVIDRLWVTRGGPGKIVIEELEP